MSRAQQFLGLGMALVLAAGIGYAGWKVTGASQPSLCRADGRPIHANMRTVAMLGGQREFFCCPTCAISAAAQTHQTVRFEQLADFDTGHSLRPAAAFAVEGSDVIPCVRSHQIVNRDGQAVPLAFDRCSPSILAFATRGAAETFASQHGGRVASFLELVSRRTTVSAPR